MECKPAINTARNSYLISLNIDVSYISGSTTIFKTEEGDLVVKLWIFEKKKQFDKWTRKQFAMRKVDLWIRISYSIPSPVM